MLGLKHNKLVLKQQIDVSRDVLSVCFDAVGNLWISNGPTTLKSADSTNLLDVSQYNATTSSYLPINTNDPLVQDVNKCGTAVVEGIEMLPDYYDIGKLGKASIAVKYEKKNEKFRIKRLKMIE